MDGQQEQWCGLSTNDAPITPPFNNCDGHPPSTYFFSSGDATFSDMMGQSSGGHPCIEPFLDGFVRTELGEAIVENVNPATCFPPLGGPDAILGMQPSEGLANPETPTTSLTRLRTSRKPGKQTSFKPRKPTPAAEVRDGQLASRNNHNQVEKKYRDRLNDQFERLLATLATSLECDQDDNSHQPLSKSAVLALARRRLMVLEKENWQLAADVERLTSLLQLR